jgi:hypothetical protein
VFRKSNCAQCHSGAAFTDSAAANLRNIGTIKPSSGKRLGGTLTGIDTPTLRDVWATAPYLHDGSASTLAAAVTAHAGVSLSSADLSSVVAYVEQIGSQETTAPAGTADTTAPSIPTGLAVSLSNGKPRVSWNASTDNVGVTAYTIYRSTNGTLGAQVAKVTSRTWTDPSVVEGTTYTYAVRAQDAANNLSGSTALVSIKAFQAPTAPTTLTATLSGGDPVLKWSGATDNVGVTGYIVYRTLAGVRTEVARPTTTTWTDRSAVAGKTYSYTVKARDGAGNTSGYSPAATIKAQ